MGSEKSPEGVRPLGEGPAVRAWALKGGTGEVWVKSKETGLRAMM